MQGEEVMIIDRGRELYISLSLHLLYFEGRLVNFPMKFAAGRRYWRVVTEFAAWLSSIYNKRVTKSRMMLRLSGRKFELKLCTFDGYWLVMTTIC